MSDAEFESNILQMGGITLHPGERIGPYVYERPVGKGGMALVVLARDPNDDPVALKILRGNRLKTGLQRFRREFRALSRVRHPNVIRVDAYGDLHGHPYIVMEYVEGTDLHQTIRNFRFLEDPNERWRRSEEILIEICRALSHVHQKGLVHRDLKPSNILLDKAGHCKLTDFGIVKDLDPSADANVSGTLVGTWAYASPEQISGEPLDHRSDLYSLGIIFFAMLTGCRPFDEKDMKGYLEAHRNKKPPRPRQYDHRIPRSLDEICQKLLEKDPKARFQSAREVLYRLEQTEAEVPSGLGEGWQPPLVGRGAELEVLYDAVNHLTRGEGGLIAVEGREGSGRTRLLNAVADRAANIGVPVHRLEASTGAAGLFGLIDFCKSVAGELGDRAPAPLLRAIDEWTTGAGRGGDAVYRLMDRLRPAVVQLVGDGPRILLYDDFHLLPPRGLELVKNLLQATIDVGEPVLGVFGVRSESVTAATETFLRGEGFVSPPVRLRLEDLSLAALQRLTEKMLGAGPRSDALARRLHQETQGNPLFITQFLSALHQQGMLVEGPIGLELSADTEEILAGHLEIPAGVRQVIRGRLSRLEPGEREALELLAVYGRSLDLDLSLEVLDRDEDEVLDAIDGLITRGIVIERRAGDIVQHDVAHRLMADVVYRELSPERRSSLHRGLAEALERNFATVPAAIELVGDHYRLAGESGKAFRYLTTAARRMLARSLPAEAWELSTRAASLEELARANLPAEQAAEGRRELLEVRGEILYLRGEWAEAHRSWQALLEHAVSAGYGAAEVRARCRLATLLRRMDRVEEAREHSRLALERARGMRDRGLIAQALYTGASLAWEDGELARVEQDAAEGLVLTSSEPLSRVRGDMLLALAAAEATQGRMASASKRMEEAVALFERLGEKAQLCIALCNLSQMLTWQGRLSEARARADEAQRIAITINFRVGQATALGVRGEANLELGLTSQATRDLTQALEEANALGLTPDLIAARFGLARLALRARNPKQAESHLSIARGLALRSDPERYRPAIVALNAWCCAMTGDRLDAERMLEVAQAQLDKLPVPRRVQVMIAAARALESLGRLDDARALANTGTSLARSRGFRLIELEGRLMLSGLAETDDAKAAWRAEAEALARALRQELPAELAEPFFARPELAELGG
ncbi:MAG: protein kinase [Deltaproteobacteria bacterium]|nr:protein kinase [Deltaproteobacteria bacterium]